MLKEEIIKMGKFIEDKLNNDVVLFQDDDDPFCHMFIFRFKNKEEAVRFKLEFK